MSDGKHRNKNTLGTKPDRILISTSTIRASRALCDMDAISISVYTHFEPCECRGKISTYIRIRVDKQLVKFSPRQFTKNCVLTNDCLKINLRTKSYYTKIHCGFPHISNLTRLIIFVAIFFLVGQYILANIVRSYNFF